MQVPQKIREVPRPPKTSVYSYGNNDGCYGVRCTDRDSENFGKVVGHIKNMVYVPITGSAVPDMKNLPVDYKDWGEVALGYILMNDIYFDLQDFFSTSDTQMIVGLSILRACYPGITDHQLKPQYEKSFLSDWLPKLPLCKDNVSRFINTLGCHYGMIRTYMKHRAEAIKAGDHTIIDGTLKTNDSTVNTFSDFSRKGRIKNRNDHSLLYAYSLESSEPICSECFPGNMVDSTSGIEFIKNHHLTKGIIVTDKGFPPGTLRDYIASNPDLHYLIPLKRGAKEEADLSLHKYEGVLSAFEGVLYKKVTVHQLLNKEGKVVAREVYSEDKTLIESIIDKPGYLRQIWPSPSEAEEFDKLLMENNVVKDPETKEVVASRRILHYYAYVDPYITYREVKGWIARESRNGISTPADFYKQYKDLQEDAGTIIFESDMDLTPDRAYEIFDSRWEIEVFMKCYKLFSELDSVREHDDWSVVGSEFINFFSSLLGIRFENYIRNCGIKGKSGEDVLLILKRAKKIFSDGEWSLSPMSGNEFQALQTLGLIPKPEPKKVGRPSNPKSDVIKPKRSKGRPRKGDDSDEPPKLRFGKRGRPSAEARAQAEAEYAAAMAQWKARHPESTLV